jgi:hypothetical protein
LSVELQYILGGDVKIKPIDRMTESTIRCEVSWTDHEYQSIVLVVNVAASEQVFPPLHSQLPAKVQKKVLRAVEDLMIRFSSRLTF